jgi:GAF domain-containing protein
MGSTGRKRGAARKRVELFTHLARVLRAPSESERMIKSVASLLAVEIGQYCIVDFIDRSSVLRRIEIEHADPSRRARLRVICEDTMFSPTGRIVRLLAKGGSEIVPKVEGARTRALSDVILLRDEDVRSYMGTTISIAGAVMGVITLVVTQGTRRYGREDLGTLESAAEWIGLGLENAIRREREGSASIAPPRYSGVPPRHSMPVAGTSRDSIVVKTRA